MESQREGSQSVQVEVTSAAASHDGAALPWGIICNWRFRSLRDRFQFCKYQSGMLPFSLTQTVELMAAVDVPATHLVANGKPFPLHPAEPFVTIALPSLVLTDIVFTGNGSADDGIRNQIGTELQLPHNLAHRFHYSNLFSPHLTRTRRPRPSSRRQHTAVRHT